MDSLAYLYKVGHLNVHLMDIWSRPFASCASQLEPVPWQARLSRQRPCDANGTIAHLNCQALAARAPRLTTMPLAWLFESSGPPPSRARRWGKRGGSTS